MLELMRRKAQSTYIQATIIIIVLVFVFWGVGTNNGPGRNDAATVNDQPISYRDFQQAYERTVEQYRKQFNGSLPESLIKMLNLRQQVMNQLVDRTLLLQGAQEMGLRVSTEEVQMAIQSMGSFQNGNGTFDIRRYKQILAGSRLTPTNFEASIRTDLLTNKVIDALGRFARVTPEEVHRQFVYDYETTTLAYLDFTADEFANKVKINEDGLASFYESRKTNYNTAPQIKLNYLFFGKKDVPPPTEAEVRAYYDQNIDRYKIPERRRARHILVATTDQDSIERRQELHQKVEKILAEAKAGADFGALAKKYSEDKSAEDGGDLGFFVRGRMVPAFEEAAFALKEGEISDIVQTPFGFHIIKLETISYPGQRKFSEVKDEIFAAILAQKGTNYAFANAGAAYEQIILAGSMQKYAEQNNITINNTKFFTQDAAPEKLADKPALLAAAFSLNKGELSSIVEDDNGYSILTIEDRKAPETPPLADVRARVEKGFIEIESRKLAEEAANNLLEAVHKGSSLAAEAAKMGRTVKEATYSRSDQGQTTLPGAVMAKGLELSANAPTIKKVIADGAAFYVASLKERKDPATEDLAAKETELREKLLQEKRTAILNAWLENLKRKAEISINKQLLDQ